MCTAVLSSLPIRRLFYFVFLVVPRAVLTIFLNCIVHIALGFLLTAPSPLSGLFPLFGHAAMNVRPALLTIYETHFVPLGRRLRPGLRGFLSGILPGLDEGSDHFDRSV